MVWKAEDLLKKGCQACTKVQKAVDKANCC